MIDQITVFLENEKGRLAALCKTIGDAGINMRAMTISESSDYGLVRIICDDPAKALETLSGAGYGANITKVSAVAIGDQPGGLAGLLEVLDEAGLNVEYGYCFTASGGTAIDVLKISDMETAARVLSEAGYKAMQPEDVYRA